MNLKPLGDRLIVLPLEEEQTTSAGIVLPDTALERPQRGSVVAVGPGERSRETGEVIPLDVAEGDTVVFSKYGGTEIKIEGEDYLILRESDVLAKVVESTASPSAQRPRGREEGEIWLTRKSSSTRTRGARSSAA